MKACGGIQAGPLVPMNMHAMQGPADSTAREADAKVEPWHPDGLSIAHPNNQR